MANGVSRYGSAKTYMQVESVGSTMTYVRGATKTVVVGYENGDEADDMIEAFRSQWATKSARGGLRLNIQGGRTQRNRRGRKHM